jgi:hypothetical protein
MIRLILGLLVLVVLLGWFLTSSPDSQISNTVKSPSKIVSKESAPVIATDLASSGKSPAADLRSTDNQSFSSPSAKQSINFQSGVKLISKNNSAATSPSRTASVGSSSSTGGSGSGSGSGSVSRSMATSYDSSYKASVGGLGGGPTREISIPVPEGAKVPAVFFDAEEKPIAQQKALDRIAQEFEKNVSEIPPGLTKEEVWEAARSIADERYLTLFGYQAFNQYHIESAKEALKEKRARSNARNP